MRTRTTTLAASLVAAFMLAAAGSLAGAAAPAHAERLSQVDLFHFPAWSKKGRECSSATVRLRAGVWQHGAFLVRTSRPTHPDLDTNPISLPARNKQKYGWRVCRTWNSVSNAYRVVSTLSRGNWSRFEVNELEAPFIHGEGNYEWGGRLAFVEPPGQTHPAG
jgi:hypothetical protein